jgi:hypothetical protein
VEEASGSRKRKRDIGGREGDSPTRKSLLSGSTLAGDTSVCDQLVCVSFAEYEGDKDSGWTVFLSLSV